MLARVTSTLTQGSAAQEVGHLLRAFPGTRMLVTHLAGQVADDCRDWGDLQVMPAHDRWGPLVQCLKGVHTAHLHTAHLHTAYLHTTGHELGPALMARVAGVDRVIQTVHAAIDPASGALVDQQLVSVPSAMQLLDEPTLACAIVSGVASPERLASFAPWYQTQRRPRLVEIRRPGARRDLTLPDLAATGALGEVECWVIGVDGPSCSSVRYFGQVADLAPLLARADVLVHGASQEGSGRVLRQAMAAGVIPALIQGATKSYGPDEVTFISSEPEAAVKQVLSLLQALSSDPKAHRQRQQRNHTRVLARGSVAAMVEGHRRLHSWAPVRDQLLKPGEIWDPVGTGRRLGRILDGGVAGDLADLCPAEQALSLWLMVALNRLPPGAHLRAMERASALLPGRFVLLRALAAARLGARRPHAALEAAEQACAIRPGSRSAWMLQVRAGLCARGAQAAQALAVAGAEASRGGELWRFSERLRLAA